MFYCFFWMLTFRISGNRLSTSVHHKPTDSHSYLLQSSSYPAHVKNSIPYSQFLRLRRFCSDDTDFSEKAEEMCQFFKTRGYPAIQLSTTANTAHSQSISNQHHNCHTTNKRKESPLTLTFHPGNISVKNINLKKF